MKEILEENGFTNVNVTSTRKYGNRRKIKCWCDPDYDGESEGSGK